MENTNRRDVGSVTIQVTVPKSQLRKVRSYLKEKGAEVTSIPEESEELPKGMRKGKFKKGEKPSQFAGAWKNRKEEDFKDFRKRAWGGRGVK